MNKHFILPDTPPDSSLIYFIWARPFCVDRCELSLLHRSFLTPMSHWLLGIILFFSCSQQFAISTCKTKVFYPCYITDLITSVMILFFYLTILIINNTSKEIHLSIFHSQTKYKAHLQVALHQPCFFMKLYEITYTWEKNTLINIKIIFSQNK